MKPKPCQTMAARVVRFRPRPTMGGDGDGERQDDERKVELDPDLKKMLEDFIGAPIDDKTHPFWNPPPLTEEQEAMFEDVKRRAKECVGLDGFTEDLLLKDMHVQYVKRSSEDKDAIEYVLTDHLRLSGMYWGLTALDLLGRLDVVDADEIVDFVQRCWVPDVGGYAPCVYHDAHVLYTLSAVQILALFDRMELIDRDAVASFLTSLQRESDGAIMGDEWGEVDTRFAYCALSISTLIDRPRCIDRGRVVEWIDKCKNFDGGYGSDPGGESHAGQVFTCVGGLALCDAVDRIDHFFLGWWLAERQVKAGGLNGRPEKLPDVCYSWWVLSSLAIMGKMHWIDHKALARFILGCQDEKKGGIADRPDDEPDVYHTFFGLAALSLMGFPGIKPIDPVFALPTHVCERIGVMRTAADGTVIGRKEENSANTGGESGGESARP